MIQTATSTPETLGNVLRDVLGLAAAGHFDVAMRMLAEFDATVRMLCAGARSGDVARWRELLDAQQRTIERLVEMRDEAGRGIAASTRARHVADAYGGG
jgi:hypothetical protein